MIGPYVVSVSGKNTGINFNVGKEIIMSAKQINNCLENLVTNIVVQLWRVDVYNSDGNLWMLCARVSEGRDLSDFWKVFRDGNGGSNPSCGTNKEKFIDLKSPSYSAKFMMGGIVKTVRNQ
ncbi:MAG TPA: hypothetical protein VMW91_03360 [Desulfosporosinus sp.]|nr:hypothetical protein [Desulfosporosinus sp.]